MFIFDAIGVLVFWLFFSIVAGIIASNKGRSGFGFFLLSAFLSPVIGIIAALVADRNSSVVETRKINTGESKKCPYCAELIKNEAIVCRFCGKDLTTNNLNPSIADYVSIQEFATLERLDLAVVEECIDDGLYKVEQINGKDYIHKSNLSQ